MSSSRTSGWRTRTLSCIALVLTVSALAACGSDSSSGGSGGKSAVAGCKKQGSPFRVLDITSLSGDFGPLFGASSVHGLQAATTVVNRTGGILCHPVVVTSVDDRSTPAGAITAYRTAIAKQDYNVIVAATAFAPALAPLLGKQKSLVFTSSTAQQLTGPPAIPNTYSLTAPQSAQAQGVLVKLKELNIKNIGLTGPDVTSTAESATAMQKVAQAAGIKATVNMVPVASVNVTSQMQQLRASGAQALVVTGTGAADLYIYQAMKTLGWKVPILCNAGCAANAWSGIPVALRKPILMQAYPFATEGTPETTSPDFKTYLDAMAPLHDKFPLGEILPVVTYSSVITARAAAVKANSIDPPKMIAAMGELHEPSQIPGWIGSKILWNDRVHQVGFDPKDWVWTTPAPPKSNGLWTNTSS